MPHSIKMTLMLCVIFGSSNGCTTTTKAIVVNGAGFSLLTPKRETQVWVVNNDLPFAKQIAAHNETCKKMTACQK